jgi:hypothetical protein
MSLLVLLLGLRVLLLAVRLFSLDVDVGQVLPRGAPTDRAIRCDASKRRSVTNAKQTNMRSSQCTQLARLLSYNHYYW